MNDTPTKLKCGQTPTKATCDRTPTPRTDELGHKCAETAYNPQGDCDLLWLFARQLERELTEANEYADKLAAGLPDGMLPKDVEVLREANLELAVELTAVTEQRDRLAEAMRKIKNAGGTYTDPYDELDFIDGVTFEALQSLTEP